MPQSKLLLLSVSGKYSIRYTLLSFCQTYAQKFWTKYSENVYRYCILPNTDYCKEDLPFTEACSVPGLHSNPILDAFLQIREFHLGVERGVRTNPYTYMGPTFNVEKATIT